MGQAFGLSDVPLHYFGVGEAVEQRGLRAAMIPD